MSYYCLLERISRSSCALFPIRRNERGGGVSKDPTFRCRRREASRSTNLFSREHTRSWTLVRSPWPMRSWCPLGLRKTRFDTLALCCTFLHDSVACGVRRFGQRMHVFVWFCEVLSDICPSIAIRHVERSPQFMTRTVTVGHRPDFSGNCTGSPHRTLSTSFEVMMSRALGEKLPHSQHWSRSAPGVPLPLHPSTVNVCWTSF